MDNIEKMAKNYVAILEQLKNHQIPEAYPEADRYPFLFGEKSLDEGSLFVRDEVIRLCGYCYISYNWIRPLAEWIGERNCLEIMCGSGALSFALQSCGVQIHATDDYSWERQNAKWFQQPWTEIEKIDCVEAIQKYGLEIEIIVCSWLYMNDTCYLSLQEMRRINPNMQMIYIGELAGGATASDAFFDIMEDVEDDSFYEAVKSFRSAYGIHDRIFLIK